MEMVHTGIITLEYRQISTVQMVLISENEMNKEFCH